jgi:hypothetical protein
MVERMWLPLYFKKVKKERKLGGGSERKEITFRYFEIETPVVFLSANV